MKWTLRPGAGAGTAGLAARVGGGVVGLYLLGVLFFWWWWDSEPDAFDVAQEMRSLSAPSGLPADVVVTGSHTAAAMIRMGSTLLDKRGGYLSNDLFPPGVWMDNVPSWEFGVVVQMRDMSRVLRADLSRSQSQSTEDPDLSLAEAKFFFNNASWIFPQTESEYADGVEYLESYLARLSDPEQPDAQFYARADNLRTWLTAVETRLGSLSQRLSASVGKRQLDTALSGDPAARQATPGLGDSQLKTSWFEIDDVFYEARGQAWALLHLLRAVERDFGPVLEDKNARVSLQQIVRELEGTQETIWSPMILNGTGFGFVANHSLVMASYISRANAAIIDLRALLAQG